MPGAQGGQLRAPASGAKVPGAQLRHCGGIAEAKLPGPQVTHADAPTAEVEPGAQVMHPDEPGTAANVPELHAKQIVDPLDAE